MPPDKLDEPGDPALSRLATLIGDLGLEATVQRVGLDGTLRTRLAGPPPVTPGRLPLLSIRGLDDARPTVDAAARSTPPGGATDDAARPGAAASGTPAPLPDLELREVIGEGGMGVVRLATQVPLSRDVAVKAVRPTAASAEYSAALVQEATITGALEHPSIVPIHTLGRSPSGEPLLVMKRIEGVAWRRLIADPQHAAFGQVMGDVHDRLEWHLRVLVQVCHAVHFAHSRRIIHRDLKPDNVMIGRYGEVYVLDWGIALRLPDPELSPALSGRAIGAAASTGSLSPSGLVGTPAYMAPEMTRTEGAVIDQRTDVYLLGAILHEVLTGQPRHTGTLYQVLVSAHRSAPQDYGPEVPAELAAIANRAMSRDPSDRHPSADALARALGEFLRQRSAIELCARASQRVDELAAALEGPAASPAARDPVALYRLFGECRFAFQHALETAPANTQARAGLQRCVQLMAGHELDQGNAEGAAAMLAELPDPPPELLARVDEERRKKSRQAEELAHLKEVERDLDVRVGSRARAATALAIGVGFNLAVTVWNHLQGGQLDVRKALVIAVALLVSVVAGGFVVRQRILKNAASRRLMASLVLGCALMVVNRVCALLLGGQLAPVMAADFLLLAACSGIGAITIDRRLKWVPFWFVAAALTLASLPGHLTLIAPVATLGGVLLVALGWRQGEQADTSS